MSKGSTQRPTDKKKFDEHMDSIFGERDPSYYQKDKKAEDKKSEEEKPIIN
jgi:hypothetical protein